MGLGIYLVRGDIAQTHRKRPDFASPAESTSKRLVADLLNLSLRHVDVEVVAMHLVGLGTQGGAEDAAGGRVGLAQKAGMRRVSRDGQRGGGRAAQGGDRLVAGDRGFQRR